jgi:hypothetical protein
MVLLLLDHARQAPPAATVLLGLDDLVTGDSGVRSQYLSEKSAGLEHEGESYGIGVVDER